MKVYDNLKGAYITFKPKSWVAGTEFMVKETDNSIELIKLEATQ